MTTTMQQDVEQYRRDYIAISRRSTELSRKIFSDEFLSQMKKKNGHIMEAVQMLQTTEGHEHKTQNRINVDGAVEMLLTGHHIDVPFITNQAKKYGATAVVYDENDGGWLVFTFTPECVEDARTMRPYMNMHNIHIGMSTIYIHHNILISVMSIPHLWYGVMTDGERKTVTNRYGSPEEVEENVYVPKGCTSHYQDYTRSLVEKAANDVQAARDRLNYCIAAHDKAKALAAERF